MNFAADRPWQCGSGRLIPFATEEEMTPLLRRRAFVTAAAATLAAPALTPAQETENAQMSNGLQHINPDSMHKNPAFSQGIIIPAGARLLVIGGQNAANGKGEVVGKGDIAAQTTQAVDNLITVLETAGGRLEDLVRVGLILREDADLMAGFNAWMQRAGKLKNPPTVTTAIVSKLAVPDFLIEIEGLAVLP
jgi:enamine deaminase RidA (YjgF/YER057c/UK114 family)